MTNQEKFDSYLKLKNYPGAYFWLMDKITWNPDVTELRGMCGYLMYLFCYFDLSTEITRDVTIIDPRNEWALASNFFTTPLKNIETQYLEAKEQKPFRLGKEWLLRFAWAGDERNKAKLVYCLANFGNMEQKTWLSENWLHSLNKAEEEPVIETHGQLSLPLGQSAKKTKRKADALRL